MKRNHKNAFTLTEVLIALTVIGVVAATIIPMANKFKPDEDKVKYLQTYDAINQAVKRTVQNESAFPAILENGLIKYDISDFPFLHSAKLFCDNFVLGLNFVGAPPVCTGGANDSSLRFVTKNGDVLDIHATRSLNSEEGSFVANVILLLDGDLSKRHTLEIGPQGKIAITDPKGAFYYGTRALWRKMEYDAQNWEDDVQSLEQGDTLIALNDHIYEDLTIPQEEEGDNQPEDDDPNDVFPPIKPPPTDDDSSSNDNNSSSSTQTQPGNNGGGSSPDDYGCWTDQEWADSRDDPDPMNRVENENYESTHGSPR